jgi:hypothetical protein
MDTTFQEIQTANAGWLVRHAPALQEAGLLDVAPTALIKMNTARRYTVYKRLLNKANENDFVTISEYLEYIQRRRNSPVRRFLAAIGLID